MGARKLPQNPSHRARECSTRFKFRTLRICVKYALAAGKCIHPWTWFLHRGITVRIFLRNRRCYWAKRAPFTVHFVLLYERSSRHRRRFSIATGKHRADSHVWYDFLHIHAPELSIVGSDIVILPRISFALNIEGLPSRAFPKYLVFQRDVDWVVWSQSYQCKIVSEDSEQKPVSS